MECVATPVAHTYAPARRWMVLGLAAGLIAGSGACGGEGGPTTELEPVRLSFSSGPTDVVAGSAIDPPVQVSIVDENGVRVPTATHEITLSIGEGPDDAELVGTLAVNAVAGLATFADLVSMPAGTYRLRAEAEGLSGATSGSFEVVMSEIGSLVVTVAPATAVAGEAVSVTVSARDPSGAVATSYRGAISLSASDEAASLPDDHGFTEADAGEAVFEVVLRTAGTQVIEVVDVADGNLSAQTETVVEAAAPVASTSAMAVTPVEVEAGDLGQVTVTVRDAFGNGVPGVTVALASDGADDELTPATGTTDAGGAFAATLTSLVAEEKRVTATVDHDGTFLLQEAVTFVPGAPDGILVSVVQAMATANGSEALAYVLTVRDANENPVGAGIQVTVEDDGENVVYTGGGATQSTDANGQTTFTATSVDAQADVTFTFRHPVDGGDDVTVTAQGTFVAGPPDALTSSLAVDETRATADGVDVIEVTVTLRDAQGNPVSGHGVAIWLSGDGNQVTPEDGDTDGLGAFESRLSSTHAEEKSITVTVDEQGWVLNHAVVFEPGPASNVLIEVIGPSPSKPFAVADLVLTVLDDQENVVTGWEGILTLSSSDAGAIVPSPVAFSTGDEGTQTLEDALAFSSAGVHGLEAEAEGGAGPTGATTVTVVAGSLVDVQVVQANLDAGQTGDVWVSLQTESPLPGDGSIEVDFPPGFDLEEAMLHGVGGADGDFTLEISDRLARLLRSGGGRLEGGTTITVHLGAVRNPYVDVVTGSYDVGTRTVHGGLIDEGQAPGPTLHPPTLAFQPLLSTKASGRSIQVDVDSAAREITVTGLIAGRWWGFSVHENGGPVESFACDDLPEHATAKGSWLLLDVGHRDEAGTETFFCATSFGAVRIDLNYDGSDIALASGWRLAGANVQMYRPSISMDGAVVASEVVVDGTWQIVVMRGFEADPVLVSVNLAGEVADGRCYEPSLSADGRFVAFRSDATNLVDGATTTRDRIYVKDLETGEIALASADEAGAEADAQSFEPSLSADGRYVAFRSDATNLVDGVDTARSRIYVKDLVTGEIVLASTDEAGVDANAGSYEPRLSADGRYVAFSSWATNLVDGVTSTRERIYVKDLEMGGIALASTDAAGVVANSESSDASLSADGRYVAFSSRATNLVDGAATTRDRIYVKDLETGEIALASTDEAGADANDRSQEPSLSADGRYVAFRSDATNLVDGAITTQWRIYVKDLATGEIALASSDEAGTDAEAHGYEPSLSADGRYVAFRSGATNLVDGATTTRDRIYVKDLETGEIALTSTDEAGADARDNSFDPSLSADGRYVAFSSWATNLVDGASTSRERIYVKDLETGKIALASTDETGADANGPSSTPSLSADGRYVAFRSSATNLVDGTTTMTDRIYVKDLETGEIALASSDETGADVDADAFSFAPSLSADGRHVAFRSNATNLVDGAATTRDRIYVKDLETGEIALASTDEAGADANDRSQEPSLSADGRYVAFRSVATNLVDGATTTRDRIYVKDLETGEIALASSDEAGADANGHSYEPSLSADGRYVAFGSNATNLVDVATTSAWRIYVKDLETGEIVLASSDEAGADVASTSTAPSLSADGRYVAFSSWASNLVDGTTTTRQRIYVKNVGTGEIALASSSGSGEDANLASDQPSLSADGRHVAFRSVATNLVHGASTWRDRIYVKDLGP
jgi:Tol biopolymer transport system component